MNGLKYFLLQLKDCMMETLCWLKGGPMSIGNSVTRKKLPYVYKSCPKMISVEKWMILALLQKFAYNVGNLGKIIFATDFELLPKVQKIAQSGHTDWQPHNSQNGGSGDLFKNVFRIGHFLATFLFIFKTISQNKNAWRQIFPK